MGRTYCRFSRKRDCRSRAGKSAGWRILSAPADSKVCFGMPENPAPKPPPLLRGRNGFDSKSSNLKIKNAMAKKIKGRPRNADPCGTTSIRTPAVEIRHAAEYLAYILCNWVKYNAKLVRSHNQRIRSTAVCKTVKRKHGLTFSEGKENVRTGKLHDRIK